MSPPTNSPTPPHEYHMNPPLQPRGTGRPESHLTPSDHGSGVSPPAVREERFSATHTAHVSVWRHPKKAHLSRGDGHANVTTRDPDERTDPGAARGARSKARTLWTSAANVPGNGLWALAQQPISARLPVTYCVVESSFPNRYARVIPAGKQNGSLAAFHGVRHPTTLAEAGSDLHRACLPRLCCAFRFSQPLDALFRPQPLQPCFMPVTPLGFHFQRFSLPDSGIASRRVLPFMPF
jgi:hypothetical protein